MVDGESENSTEQGDHLTQPEGLEGGQRETPQEIPQTLVELIAERSEEVIALVESLGDRMLESREAQARFTFKMAWLAVFIVVFIVVAAGFLTYVNRIDGATFAFLLGLVSGYMLNFVRDSLGQEAT